MLLPDNVSVPVPSLVSDTLVAEPFCITPLYVVLLLFPPTVRVGVPAVELVTDPAPANDPTVSLKPLRLKVLATVRALPSGITSEAPKVNVPALIVVVPEYVFAPEIMRVPVPVALVKAPVPLIIPP